MISDVLRVLLRHQPTNPPPQQQLRYTLNTVNISDKNSEARKRTFLVIHYLLQVFL